MNRFTKVLAGVGAATALALAGCTTDADRVNENLNKGAESFEVQRTIVFINGITDKYLAVVEGRCSIERDADKMQAVCKVGPDKFERHEIGLSDNVTYMALQTQPSTTDPYRLRIVIKPENALPDFDIQTGSR